MSLPRQPTDRERLRGQTTLKTLGWINVIFGGLLLLYGACTGAVIAALPAIERVSKQAQAQVEARDATRRQAAIDELTKREAEADTDEAKAELRVQRRRLERAPRNTMMSPTASFGWMAERSGMVLTAVQTLTMMGLNLVLVIAGVGLMKLRPWGRSTSLFVAWAKIVLLIGFTVWYASYVAPNMATAWAKDMSQALAPGQVVNAPLDTDAIRWTSLWFGFLAALVNGLGLIYPIVSIVLLRRPSSSLALQTEGPRPNAG